MKDLLRNYRSLVAKVDAFCGAVSHRLGAHMLCAPGCAACCRAITVFPVEAFALAHALAQLPTEQVRRIRTGLSDSTRRTICPLLAEARCQLYAARPVICRTHGLPLLTRRGGDPQITWCPRNFNDLSSIPGDAVLDLETLNRPLAVINRLFLTELPGGTTLPERLSIAEALRLPWPPGRL